MRIRGFFSALLVLFSTAQAAPAPCLFALSGKPGDRKLQKYYELARAHYGAARDAVTGAPLLANLNEGLTALELMGADWVTKAAWCIRDLVQSDEALKASFTKLAKLDGQVVALAMELRNISGAGSPLQGAQQIAIARHLESRRGFENWIARLGVSETRYERYVEALTARLSDYVASVTPTVKARTGDAQVGVATVMFPRATGDLYAQVYFPETGGDHPVIVFAHGGGLDGRSHEFLGRFWASHGYISVHPTLPGADASILRQVEYSKITPEDREFNRKALAGLGASRAPIERSIEDLKFLIQKLPAALKKVPGFGGAPDLHRLGVAGYSYGGQVALAAAGAGGKVMPGVRAFLSISPPAGGFTSFGPQSWEGIKAPLFTLSGTEDVGMLGEPAELRAEPFLGSTEGDKYHALFDGVNHYGFVHRRPDPVKGAADEIVRERMKVLTLLYWDSYLQGLPERRTLLESPALKSALEGVTVFGR